VLLRQRINLENAMAEPDLGAAIARLAATVASRKGGGAAPETSYTASLLAGGAAKCAKKFGEEAVELAMAAVAESDERVAAEAGDVIYHLLVLLAARGIAPSAVAAALIAREGKSGHAEKAMRKKD
jgi:phosphoribosyl-ATP pyrophosphohydrolase